MSIALSIVVDVLLARRKTVSRINNFTHLKQLVYNLYQDKVK